MSNLLTLLDFADACVANQTAGRCIGADLEDTRPPVVGADMDREPAVGADLVPSDARLGAALSADLAGGRSG